MLRKILIGLAICVAVLVGIISIQPAEYRVTRAATIAAPPAALFEMVNDFHKWEAWSPWAKLDPAMKTTYEGSPAGQGAVYTWAGNNDVGEGRMTIVESAPNDRVRIKLEFIKPFASNSITEFTFRPEANSVNVQWDMRGENNFFSKAFSLFMNMDKMIGADFEKGLAQMKSAAEGAAR